MTPDARLVWSSAACAATFATLAYVAIGALSGSGLAAWHRNAGASLGAVPAAALAAALAVRGILPWWHNVGRGRGWTAGALALRIVALALLLFAPLAALCIAVSTLVSRWFVTSTETLGDALQWSTAIAVYAVIFAVVLGAVPALLVEMLLCRRFLRAMPMTGMVR